MDNCLRLNIGILKYPIISIKGKTITCLTKNQYSFIVDRHANKRNIKVAIEKLYNIKISKINTITLPRKKIRMNKSLGWKPQYKKVIISLAKHNNINLFAEINKE